MTMPTPTHQTTPPAHPKAFSPGTLIVTILLSVLGAFIGMRLITTLGISANTSVIGALLAMLIGRIGFAAFRSVHRQNLAQTAISSATFGAANALLAPMAVAWAFNRADLVWPLLLGAGIGLVVDAWVLYRCFGSKFLPATGAWPPGVAAAETIKAGDEGGRQAVVLGISGLVGGIGSWFGLNFSAAGVALIGNIWALLMWGVGLTVNQYITFFPGLSGLKLSAEFIPHGVMVGAGVVSLFQAARIFLGRRRRGSEEARRALATSEIDGESPDPSRVPSVDPAMLRRSLLTGYALFIGGAIVVALGCGLLTQMSPLGVLGWVLFAATAAFVHEIIVGLAAMHSGWFPAFAVTLIFLVIGLLIGLPAIPMVALVGYCSATGPAFADMGYDLKAGWLLRRNEAHDAAYARFDLDGKRQQFFSALVGFAVAGVLVAFLWHSFFANGQVPPVSKIYADTIGAGVKNPHTLQNLLLWAIPGAVIQLIGGSKRQMGVMLATGLLIAAPNACWFVFAALLVRFIVRKTRGVQAEEKLALVGAGFIAGDALASTGKIFTLK